MEELKLYLITDSDILKGRDFYHCIEEALKGGVTMLQLREKEADGKEFLEKAMNLRELTRKYGVKFIINDRIDIAMLCDADGVHLGQSDIPAKEARKLMPGKIIGVSCRTVEEAENMLNKKSGVQGISGLAPDFREIEAASYGENERAAIAIEKFKYEIASYIAKYAVAMNGVDYIVFTGGVGENQINIRRGICEKLEFMGVKIDVEANNVRGEEKEISAPDSKVKVYLVPTNEELMIAKETARLIK